MALVETEIKHESRTVRPVSIRRNWTAEQWSGIAKFAAIIAQLVLLAVLIERYNLESPAFYQVSLLAFGGFIIHHFLPMEHRLGFFLLLSIVSILMVFGLTPSSYLVGIGIGLIGLCHLPAPFWVRVSLVGAVGLLLAGMRGGWVASVVPLSVWPILGSMFMFRILIYLYDLRHQAAPFSPLRSLSYFFMLPNVCFPLFPIVDYQSFCRSYYDADRFNTYQVGTRWIFRGIVHLILYRLVYNNWSISLYEVENAGQLAHYCLSLFLLYLRVSGQFHIIVGMLHLFGFNLPETHHLYYFSNSFTDFWRRINIYWKDFMMKIFFYPAYFRLKARGPLFALVVSTLLVFALTWLLHSVQWFWLRGTFFLAVTDIAFWSILAALVVVNSLVEVQRGRNRRGRLLAASWPGALAIGLKSLATFTVICILWSLWNSESLTAWLTLWPYAIVSPSPGGWALIAVTAAIIAVGATLMARYPEGIAWTRMSYLKESALRCGVMCVMAAVTITAINQRFGNVGKLVASTRHSTLNPADRVEMERGYYENLLDVGRFNDELSMLYSKRPIEWNQPIVETGLAAPTNDLRHYELKPSVSGRIKGAVLRTNRWGMHDREYTMEPPSGCYRIAVLGSSHGMGLGNDRELTYEALLEDRLNRESAGFLTYEFLNFAVAGYSPLAQPTVINERAIRFKPNALLYIGHPDDAGRAAHGLTAAVHKDIALGDPFLRSLVEKLHVNRDTPQPIIRRRIAPYGEEILAWVYRTMIDSCRRHNMRPICVMLNTFPGNLDPVDASRDIEMAEQAGFTVLDLMDVYPRNSGKTLWIAEWDGHPNNAGQRLIAARLYELFRERELIPFPNPQKGAQSN